jgi:MFS family permease
MARLDAARNERNVLLLAGVGHFATHFFELMFPTLAVVIASELELPFAEVLGWSLAGYVLFGLGALPWGVLADRFGARRVVLIGLAGMGVSALAAAEATPGRSLAICLASLGLFASSYHPAGMSLISHTSVARGRALGINGIFGNLGIAVTPLLTATLAAQAGTRHAFHFAGLAACAAAVALGFLRIDERPDATRPVGDPQPGTNHVWLFVVLCVAAMLAGIIYRGNTVAQPAYFAERVSLLHFGLLTSLVYLIGVGGPYVGGTLADRYDLRWLYLLFHLATVPLLLLMSRTTDGPLLGAAALLAFFSLGMQPIENSLFARFTPARWRATGYGLKFVLTFGVGASAVGLVQWAQTDGDLSRAFLYLAGVAALLVLTIGGFITASGGAPLRNDAARADPNGPVIEPVV